MEFMTSLQSGLDEQKPSLFELLSEQQLAALIPPSLRYLLAVATHRNPRYLLRVLNSFDEIYALTSLLLERYYLRTFGGGFTENFYGLKREKVLRVKTGEIPRAQLGAPREVRETLKLRERDIWRNLAVMVALPYIKRKLDEAYDVHASGINLLGPGYRDREPFPSDDRLRAKILWLYKWFLRKVYPSINAAYYFSLLAFNLAYLFDGSKYHSPWLWLIGTRIRRLNAADGYAIAMAAQAAEAKVTPGARPGQTNSIFSRRALAQIIYPTLTSSLKLLLPTSIFALKFLEWWHASDFARQLSRKANEGLELPPPIVSGLNQISNPKSKSVPASDRSSSAQQDRRDHGLTQQPISSISGLPILTVPIPNYENKADGSAASDTICPICLGTIQAPTAAQTGFVYCYTCIHKWVSGTHPRQEAFVDGAGAGGEAWREEDDADGYSGGSRVGKWENGRGRDAVTGRTVLGGTSGLRRIMI